MVMVMMIAQLLLLVPGTMLSLFGAIPCCLHKALPGLE